MVRKKIMLLPFSKFKNPYQFILIEKLRNHNFNVIHGNHFPIFPIILNYIRYKPHLIIIDWTHQWYLKESILISILKSITLLSEYLILIYLFKVKIIQNIHNKRHHKFDKHFLLQKIFFRNLLIINKNLRFFSFKQKNLILDKNFFLRNKNIIVIREENKLDFFYSRKKRFDNNILINKNALMFGENRSNKQYFDFLKENWKLFEWDKVIINDQSLYNDLINVFGKTKVESQILFFKCPDSAVFHLFSSIETLILPYSGVVLNSGIYSLARDFKVKIITTKSYFKVIDATLVGNTKYTLNNHNLIEVFPYNKNLESKYNKWGNTLDAFWK